MAYKSTISSLVLERFYNFTKVWKSFDKGATKCLRMPFFICKRIFTDKKTSTAFGVRDSITR
jgi:hypothetical protein